jgi:5'-3' exonuclease/transcription antitermination factor NusG
MTDTKWVVIELGPKADGEDPDTVRASIRHSIRDAEVFIPTSITKMGDERVIQNLFEGYAFIKRTHPDATYLRLEGTKYVQNVLRFSSNGARSAKTIAVVSDAEIERFRGQIRAEVDQGISVGDLVLITSGAYRQIKARVENEIAEKDMVQVYVELRSKQAIITLPRACLQLVQKATKSPLRERFELVRDWFRGAHALLGWPEDGVSHVILPYRTYMRLGGWLQRCVPLTRLINELGVRPTSLDLGAVQRRYEEYAQLSHWREQGVLWRQIGNLPPDIEPLFEKVQEWEERARLLTLARRGKNLQDTLKLIYNAPPSPADDARVLKWAYLQTVAERLDTLQHSIESIEKSIRAGGKSGMLQNLIVDGTQLAIRCALTPGLGELKDNQGRPTGAIIGFCQSLASLKKRFPAANIFVTWDGSSQRRRKMFDGYKASRSARSPLATFEIQFLRHLLPKMGVYQSYNPEEEADDVIATLVRSRLKGQANAFLSTDRDLLQLVTDNDHQLVPAVGVGKEKLYTVDAVIAEYGVSPERVLQVRAIAGDDSDEIPGADGFGLKTAMKLVKLYGTVDRLFSSNFAGLTSKQHNSLRAAERQIKLNLELMRLQDDLVLTSVGPDPDQIAASERLREVDIRPETLLAAFFSSASGLSASV